jgi:hypothetical protein
MYAANSANKEIVDFLVTKGANVNSNNGKISYTVVYLL